MSNRPSSFRLIINIGGAAFDGTPGGEVARILRAMADSVEGGAMHPRRVIDANGNACGAAEYWGNPPAILSLEDWVAKYEPIPDGGQECCGLDGHEYGFHTLAEAVQFALANGIGDYASHVWTITHGDGDDEDESTHGGDVWTVSPGVHRVNVVGFVITKRPHDGSEVAEWD